MTLTPPSISDSIFKSSLDGKIQIVRRLVQEDPSIVKLKDEDLRQALHWACTGSHSNVAEFLISQGAPVNAEDEV
jgi:ankyrin repeat protein